jgi:hypothetical protein
MPSKSRGSSVCGVFGVIALVIDGGHVEGLAARHFGDGGIVHAGGVFDGIGAGADGVVRAIGAVCTDGELLSEGVGGIDAGLDFVVGESLEAGQVATGAGRTVHLDDVGAGGDLRANHLKHFGYAVGGSRRCAAAAAGNDQAVPETNMRGPTMRPLLMRSRMAISA